MTTVLHAVCSAPESFAQHLASVVHEPEGVPLSVPGPAEVLLELHATATAPAAMTTGRANR